MRVVRLFMVIALAAGLLSFAGCAKPNGWAPKGHSTHTVLKKANFKVSKTNISKSVECPFILGPYRIPIIGWFTPAIPLGDYELWKRGMKELTGEAGSGHLVNVTSDYTATSYFGVYAVHKLTLTADVVDFTGD